MRAASGEVWFTKRPVGTALAAGARVRPAPRCGNLGKPPWTSSLRDALRPAAAHSRAIVTQSYSLQQAAEFMPALTDTASAAWCRFCAGSGTFGAPRNLCKHHTPMADADLPSYLTRGIALSKAQLRTSLGTELLSLCRSFTADGRLAPEELTALRQWLDHAEVADMPALRHLRLVIERVLADGRITPEEYQDLYRAVESVLPFEDRQRAVAARLQVEAAEKIDRAPADLRTRIVKIAVALVLAGAAVAWLAGWLRHG
jgi:hypothetical protein